MPQHAPRDRTLTALVLALPLVAAVLVTAFAWPAANSEPQDVPVAVVLNNDAPSGPLGRLGGDAFDVHRVTDRAAAVALIEDREVYGALVPGPSGLEVLTATAASPAVARMLSDVGHRAGAEGAMPVSVSDVAPGTSDDPAVAGLVAGSLPVVLAGIIIAAATARLRRHGERVVAALAAAALTGVSIALVLHAWLGSLAGSFGAEAGVIALGVAAVAIALVALRAALGLPGFAIGGVTMVLLGNPLSGAMSAPELLPTGWGAFGQLLPPGATVSALRSVGFFDGAGAGGPLVVLVCWLLGGLLLAGVAPLKSRRQVDVTPVDEPVRAAA